MQLTSFILAKNVEFTTLGRFRIHQGGLAHVYFKPPATPLSALMFSCKALLALRAQAAEAGSHRLTFSIRGPGGAIEGSGDETFQIPAEIGPAGYIPPSPYPPYHETEVQLVPGSADRQIMRILFINIPIRGEGVSIIEIRVDDALVATAAMEAHAGEEPKIENSPKKHT